MTVHHLIRRIIEPTDATIIRCIFVELNQSQHVSGIIMPIIRRTRTRLANTYAAPVWSNTSNTNYRHLQTLQSKCLRVIGNYPRRTPIPLIHSTLNIEPLHEFIHRLAETFFHQCSIHQNPLVRQIGDYTMADLQHQYKKYIHKRTKHLLL
jgi:hypothetical protein